MSGSRLDGNHTYGARTWYCFGKTSDFVKPGPARTYTFIEEDPYSLNDGVFSNVGPRTPQVYKMIDWPSALHDRSGAIGFADGHVELHRWTDDRTLLYRANVASANQPGNVDIRWLAEHTTALISP